MNCRLATFFSDFRRNLDYFLSCMQSAVNAVDPEAGGGELTVRIPKEVLACANGKNHKGGPARVNSVKWHGQKVATLCKMKSRQEATSLGQIVTVMAKPTISDKHLSTLTRDGRHGPSPLFSRQGLTKVLFLEGLCLDENWSNLS